MIVEYHIIGPAHHLFGWHLVGDTRHNLLLSHMVAFLESGNTLWEIKVDADNLVHQGIEAVVVKYGALEEHIGFCGMLAAESVEIGHHTRVNQCVEAKEF